MNHLNKIILASVISSLLTACGGGGADTTQAVTKSAPTAITADDFNAEENTSVTLDGSQSRDSDGSIVSYAWTQTSGASNVEIINSDASIASFTAPDVNSDIQLIFQLTVTDNDGQSNTDTVNVGIQRKNLVPQAKTPGNMNVVGTDLVTLDGNESIDPDGSIVGHDWVQLSGTPTVTINNANQPTATFTAPNVNAELSFQLTVTDNDGAIDTKTVIVSSQQLNSDNKAPIVSLDSALNTKGYNTVILNGSSSTDPDGTIVTYNWTQISGSPTVAINKSNKAINSFSAPNVTTKLTFQLRVTDNDGASSTDNIEVNIAKDTTTSNRVPKAIIVSNANVEAQATHLLDGRASFDSDGSIVSYTWIQTSGINVSLSTANQAFASFSAPEVNANSQLGFQLTVTDDKGATHTDSTTVTIKDAAENQAPVASAAGSSNVDEATIINLNGNASNDTDGSIVSYAWVQTSGTAATITNANQSVTTVIAPDVTTDSQISFQLTVTDDRGATHTDSINVMVKDVTTNQAPLAVAGNDFSADENSVQTLNGSASNDTDGSIVSYAWVQTSGSNVVISNANQSVATFTAPDVNADTQVSFQLTVTDDAGSINADTITVSILDLTANQAPTAVTANNFSAYEKQSITLTGNASNDTDGNIVSYSWTQIAGSAQVAISSPTAADASFMAPDITASTVLTFELLVTDNDGLTDTSSVQVTVLPEVVNNPNPSGVVYYVSDCGAYADPDCVAGNDNNDGLTQATAWRTYAQAHNKWSQLNGNESILLARGGSYDVSGNVRWANSNSSASNPVTLSDYQPTWGSGNEARPVITQNNSAHVFEINPGWGAAAQSGFTFKNLDIRCTGSNTSGWGFFFYNKVDDVILDNVSIDNCDIGIHIGEAAAGITARLSLLNSSITNNRGHGFLGGGDNHVIQNNYFSDNGSGTARNHNFYLSGTSDGVVFSGNTVQHSSLDASGVCMGSSVIVHGVHSNLLIENNTISEEIGKASYGCWGLTVSPAYTSAEAFTNVIIRGNTVINVGNLGIGVGACKNCLIENNFVTQDQAMDFTAIAAPLRASGAGDMVMSDIVIKDNSVYYGTAVAGTAILLGSEGNNHQVVNNAINYHGTGNFNCLNLDLAASAYSTVDYNTCVYDNAAQGQWELGSGDLGSWQQTGFDWNSQYVAR